jgi:hypothetical protein
MGDLLSSLDPFVALLLTLLGVLLSTIAKVLLDIFSEELKTWIKQKLREARERPQLRAMEKGPITAPLPTEAAVPAETDQPAPLGLESEQASPATKRMLNSEQDAA